MPISLAQTTHTHIHTHIARGSGPVLLMPAGRPDHSLPPQTHTEDTFKSRGRKRIEARRERREELRGRAERGQADKVETGEGDMETEADNDRWRKTERKRQGE